VRISRGWASADATLGTVGLAATAGGVIETNDLAVDDIGGLGLLQDEARGTHARLTVRGATEGGVWVQGAGAEGEAALALALADATLQTNGRVGLHARDSVGLFVERTTVRDTTPATLVGDDLRPVQISDGLQLVDLTGVLRLDQVTLADNARVGLLVDAPGGVEPTLEADAVQVTATAQDALGVQTQGIELDRSGFEIDPVLEANGAAFVAAGRTLQTLPPRAAPPSARLRDANGGLDASLWASPPP
jgi:hypothetical protein